MESVKTSRYIKEFNSLFVPLKEPELYAKARNGDLKQFRSICWRYFLHCLPKQTSNHLPKWLEACESSRRIYVKIKAKHLDGSRRPIKEPSQCDQNVFQTIERDVIRTFPDMDFFRQTDMQAIMKSILFNYASENPKLAYKQGMHELLAILLFVLHTDAQNCLINYEGGYANETIAALLDLKYLEHDLFHLFCNLMKSIETWYQNDEILIDSEVQNKASKKQVGSVLGNKLNMISENIVKRHDLELFNHLEALQIAPQIYGIRWMRLLFGREFEFMDLFKIWDALICDQVPLSLTEYIFASMLVTIREKLVNGDYTDCLNNLMRHQFKNVQQVIKLALHLRSTTSVKKQTTRVSNNVRTQQYHHQTSSSNQMLLAVKEYEMKELPSVTSSSSRSVLNISTESHTDLPNIVDYCWRLLSEQIDSLQRCLPKEKSLHSEDEIFIALAQLKKVRDVLKGSLRLDDELDSPPGGSNT